ncbi:MAG TPA: hypothetical protein VJ787_14285 [Thermoleophilia bacterium]|nr:hypothetical protein [Thermoleophilia bacterium]
MWNLTTKGARVDRRGGSRRGHQSQRSVGRHDYTTVAATEYRRALRAVLTARSETRLRMF